MTASTALPDVLAAYTGSNGEMTLALFKRLAPLGPAGVVAIDLFRAQKAAARAEVYRRGYWIEARKKMHEARDDLCRTLGRHGEALGLAWGWGLDLTRIVYPHILYIELPTGQASFGTSERGWGPNHPNPSDGTLGESPDRICRYIARVLDAEASR